MKTLWEKHWPQIVALLVASTLMIWAVGCPAKTQSPLDPTRKLTAEELSAELNNLVTIYEIRGEQLAQQERLRKLILENALLIAQTQTVNPFGIVTGLLAFYGAGSAVNSTRKVIKSKVAPTKTT